MWPCGIEQSRIFSSIWILKLKLSRFIKLEMFIQQNEMQQQNEPPLRISGSHSTIFGIFLACLDMDRFFSTIFILV